MAKSRFHFPEFFFGLSLFYLVSAAFSFIVFGPIEFKILGGKISFTSLVNPLRISFGLFLSGFVLRLLREGKGWSLLQTARSDSPTENPKTIFPGPFRWVEFFMLTMVFCGTFFFIHHYTADVAGFADTF